MVFCTVVNSIITGIILLLVIGNQVNNAKSCAL